MVTAIDAGFGNIGYGLGQDLGEGSFRSGRSIPSSVFAGSYIGYGGGVMDAKERNRIAREQAIGSMATQYAISETAQNIRNGQQEQQRVIKACLNTLVDDILSNRKDDFIPDFEKLKEVLKNAHGNQVSTVNNDNDVQTRNQSDEAIHQQAVEMLEQAVGGNLQAQIREHCTGAFWQGAKQVITLGFAESNDADDLIDYLYHNGKSDSKAEGAVGAILGGAATGAGIGFCIAGPPGAAVGAVVGAIGGAAVKGAKAVWKAIKFW